MANAELKKIEYLPKWYDKADVKARQKELVQLRKELIATGKLVQKEIDMLNDFDITLCADTYSRNYELHKINDLVDYIKWR